MGVESSALRSLAEGQRGVVFVCALLMLISFACDENSSASTALPWLSTCDGTQACASPYTCLCGVCTLPCEGADASCVTPEGRARGFCTTSGSPLNDRLCGTTSSENLCLPGCRVDSECPSGTQCELDRCIPNALCAAPDIPDVIAFPDPDGALDPRPGIGEPCAPDGLACQDGLTCVVDDVNACLDLSLPGLCDILPTSCNGFQRPEPVCTCDQVAFPTPCDARRSGYTGPFVVCDDDAPDPMCPAIANTCASPCTSVLAWRYDAAEQCRSDQREVVACRRDDTPVVDGPAVRCLIRQTDGQRVVTTHPAGQASDPFVPPAWLPCDVMVPDSDLAFLALPLCDEEPPPPPGPLVCVEVSQFIFDGGVVVEDPHIALDSNDRPVMAALINNDPNIINVDGTQWLFESVKMISMAVEVRLNGLALNSNDLPHLLFYESGNPDGVLRFARKRLNGAWTETPVLANAPEGYGRDSAFAIDSTDTSLLALVDADFLTLGDQAPRRTWTLNASFGGYPNSQRFALEAMRGQGALGVFEVGPVLQVVGFSSSTTTTRFFGIGTTSNYGREAFDIAVDDSDSLYIAIVEDWLGARAESRISFIRQSPQQQPEQEVVRVFDFSEDTVVVPSSVDQPIAVALRQEGPYLFYLGRDTANPSASVGILYSVQQSEGGWQSVSLDVGRQEVIESLLAEVRPSGEILLLTVGRITMGDQQRATMTLISCQ